MALAAKAAWASGRSFTADDVRADLIEPVVYVVLRWYCCDDVHGERFNFHPLTPFDYKIAMPGEPLVERHPWSVTLSLTSSPLWITRDVLQLLALFGAERPYDNVVLAAGYPMSVLSAGHDFVIYRQTPSPVGPRTSMTIGRVTPSDLATWR